MLQRCAEIRCVFRVVVFRNRKATTIKILVYDSCEASDYVKLKHGNSVASGGEQNRLHITRRSSEGFKPVQNGDIRSPGCYRGF